MNVTSTGIINGLIQDQYGKRGIQFNENGIQHIYINYNGFEYQQVYPGFESGMSTLDMLLNCGPEETRKIIMDDANYTFSEWNKKILVKDND